MGLLQVRMAGCGRRADISMEGGVAEGLSEGDGGPFDMASAGEWRLCAPFAGDGESLNMLKKEERFGWSGAGLRLLAWKVKGRLAYASWAVLGGLGGSMGKNLSPIWWRQFSLKMPGRCIVTLT
jgi:hypothetical protein